MKGKGTVLAAAAILYGLCAADLAVPDRYFSETEKRILQQKPEFTAEAFINGEYREEEERYVTDQFVGRDSWVALKTQTQRLLGEQLINGVYLGTENCLFRQQLSREAGGDGSLEESAEQKLPRLLTDVQKYRELCQNGRVRVLLVPSADSIWTEKLPEGAQAQQFQESIFLKQAGRALEQRLPEDTVWIDAQAALALHSQEKIYYKTDHHWTTLGAYYGYAAWAESMDMEPLAEEQIVWETVSADFQGTLQARLNIPWEADTIEKAVWPDQGECRVIYDLGNRESSSLYEPGYLEGSNQYGYFLDDNHALIQIQTKGAEMPDQSILVIKDSYANCLIPFLTRHYGTVWVMDRRYYHGKTEAFLTENQISDVLLLYQTYGFLENY